MALTNTSHPGANRALGLSTVAFTLCFAVWTLFSILGLEIKQEFGLSDAQFGLLVATPALTGSLSRLPLGIWADRFGGRWLFGVLMIVVGACVWLLTRADSYGVMLLAALGVGLAGGGFIVGAALCIGLVRCATAGHGAGHLRRRQYRRSADQYRRALAAVCHGLARRRARLRCGHRGHRRAVHAAGAQRSAARRA